MAVRSTLIGFGIAAMELSLPAFAQSDVGTSTTVQAFHIPAGPLKDALERFAKQTGVNFSFAAEELKDATTQGLSGSFSVQEGLNHLLAESGLQAVPQDYGYVIQSAEAATLPPVVVTASTPGDAGGYAAPRSISSTKLDIPLRDVPQSVSVLTQELMQDQSIRSMADAVRYVPGVGVSSGEGNRDALVFRGTRSTGDFFVDGLRDDVEYFRDWYNIERIEVLKGPNGLLFGRGGSGGVINRVTKQAGWDPIREFTFQAGSYGQKRATADINHAINDVAAFRFNGLFENSDSYRDGVEIRRFGISPTVTLKPSANTKVVVNMELFKDERIADRGIPGTLQGRPLNTHSSTFFGDPRRSPTDTNAKSINMLVEHQFNDAVTLRNRTRYAIYDKFYQNVFANSRVTAAGMVDIAAYNNQTDRENFFNQTDLLFSFNTGWFKHELVTGVEVGRQITDNRRRTGLNPGGGTLIDTVSISNPRTMAPITFTTRPGDANFHTSTSVAGVYIQDQITILPQLQAILGVRYDRFEVDFQDNRGTNNLQSRDDLISPRFGLVYKPIEPVSIYGSYSLAYVPRAGDQLTSLNVNNTSLDPERFINVEAGAKWDIRPNLALTTAFYQLDRTNMIIQDPNVSQLTMLGKGQRVRGVEVGISGRVTSAWSIMGGYAYQEGVLTQAAGNAQKGAILAELPKHSFSLWNRYNFTPNWGAAFGVIGRSNMFAAIDNAVVLPDFVRVDAALYGRLSRHMRVQVNIENLFDTKYIAAAHNNNNILPGSPIAARAMIIANF
ncbi:catecholate siderophore receptor [Nitrosovibrio sp. Nv6]|nr:catecholate siderophore receptor [Nitrosovibrio sp. Nv6]